MFQLLTNILVFLWEIFMEKNKPGETMANKANRLKKFFVFIAASLSIILNVVLMERLVRVSTNHVNLSKSYIVCTSKIVNNDVNAALLLATQNNLEMCMLRKR